MPLPVACHLSLEQVRAALSSLASEPALTVVRVRPHNRGVIRKTFEMSLQELEALVVEAVADGHIPGGDLEVELVALNQRLIGHHDGVFWLEPLN